MMLTIDDSFPGLGLLHPINASRKEKLFSGSHQSAISSSIFQSDPIQSDPIQSNFIQFQIGDAKTNRNRLESTKTNNARFPLGLPADKRSVTGQRPIK